jgi:hypothetical protein
LSVSSSSSPTQNDVIEEGMFPSAADTNHSSSSHIEVSGILISIDGIPTLDPLDEADAKASSLRTTRTDETISLGPVEISSILHEIISTSMLQSGDDKTTHINRSDLEATVSSSSSTPVEQLSTSFTSLNNDNRSEQLDVDQVTRNLEPGFSSTLPSEEKKNSVYHGPFESSNPYAHWDSDSEEQEHEMELQRLQELSEEVLEEDEEDKAEIRTSEETLHGSVGPPTSPSPSTPTAGRSYLLLLAGNSTIVRLRQKDFAKYLKLNLAARLSLEYDDVRVNRVVLAPPQLLVNVSVVTPSEAAAAIDSEDAVEEETGLDSGLLKEEEPLHMLAETNATLLELSGEEYHVVRLLSLRSHPSDKELQDEDDPSATSTTISNSYSDTELVIYTAIGGAFALVILATLFITFGRYLKVADMQWPWRRPKSLYSSWSLPSSHLRHRRMDEHPSATAAPPTVIYSGSFAARAANSWVDEYQAQPNVILKDDVVSGGGTAILGVGGMTFPSGNPLYTDLEMGGTAGNVMGHKAETSSKQRHQSPSKLHIFSCRPGSIVIPAAMPTPHHQVRRNLADNFQPLNSKEAKDTHPLDVRIREDCGLGQDNPNYQT